MVDTPAGVIKASGRPCARYSRCVILPQKIGDGLKVPRASQCLSLSGAMRGLCLLRRITYIVFNYTRLKVTSLTKKAVRTTLEFRSLFMSHKEVAHAG